MNFTLDNILLTGSILLIISIFISKSAKLGIPVLLLFIIVGMLAGSDGIGGIYFDDPNISKLIGIIALVFILFSGGLDTRYADIKPVLKQGILLSVLGVILTCLFIGVFVNLITDLSLLEGLLLGAIISSTDAASVFTILRSNNSGLKGKIRPLLEFESGSNDPMAYFLTILFIFLLQKNDISFLQILPLFFLQFFLGGLIGITMGYLMYKVINKINLDFDGLYSVLLISFALFIFSFTDYLGGNGFLAVYLAACILGNKEFIHKKSMIKHFAGQAWLMQIIMFLTLGLLVFPKQLIPLTGIGIVISLFIIFIARPFAVFISLYFSKINLRSKIFISWVGLRGAVPIVLAIYALQAKIHNAELIFNLVFFISVISVLIQGTSIPFLAKLLKLSVPLSIRKKSSLDIELADKVKSILIEIDVQPEFKCVDKNLVELSLPSGILISMINRDGKYIQPEGTTKILNGDKLTVIADSIDILQKFYKSTGINN